MGHASTGKSRRTVALATTARQGPEGTDTTTGAAVVIV